MKKRKNGCESPPRPMVRRMSASATIAMMAAGESRRRQSIAAAVEQEGNREREHEHRERERELPRVLEAGQESARPLR